MLRVRYLLPIASLLVVMCEASAQSYPTRAVRIIVAYPAGGSIDTTARLVAPRLNAAMGQPFVIDNRSGAAGIIGTDLVAKAQPDGYTLLMGSAAAIGSAPSMYKKLPYDSMRDLAPIILIANQPNVLTVHPSVPSKTVKDFIALAKGSPGKFNYGSSGIGATQHMTAELFAMATGAKIVHVPYRGGTPAMIDLIAGHIDFMFTPAPNAIPVVRSGKVRALAVTSASRSANLSDLPTMREAGLKDFELVGWIGLLAPAAAPAAVIDRLNSEVQKMMNDDLKPKLLGMGLDVAGGSPARFSQFIKADIDKYARIVKAAAIPTQ